MEGKELLYNRIQKKKSFLCVGLDTDLAKIPKHLLKEEDPIFEFNKAIIDATAEFCVAYKPNIAFYEKEGEKGWESLRKTIEYIPADILTIADAKRGDIGNTGDMYAEAFFNTYGFDAVTVAPYMGEDSVKPFLKFPGKWAIVLGLTSNPGSKDFQFIKDSEGNYFFERVIKTITTWGNSNNTMIVIGATQGKYIQKARSLAPDHFFLVPGVGAQGGSLSDVAKYAFNDQCGLLVNSARGIIYAGSDKDYAEKAGEAAKSLRDEMSILLKKYA